MKVQEIDKEVFSEFAKRHVLKNFFQTKEYGELMTHSEFSVMYIGGYKNNELVAASLILCKPIAPSIKYGYAPRGFLINYYDSELLKEFTKKVKDFFFSKGFAFIKINPEVSLATVDLNNQSKVINTKSKELIEVLKSCGYDKLKSNLYFESLLHRFTPVINLSTYNINNLSEKMKKELENIDDKGLSLISGTVDDIDKFYSYVENKDTKTKAYYKMFFEIFNKNNMADLLLLSLDYDKYIKYLQKKYIEVQEENEEVNAKFRDNPNDPNLYKEKMDSDKLLNDVSSDIALANQKMQENFTKEIYGAAFVVKYEGRVSILISGQRNEFKNADLKTYLYYKIIDEYKKAGYLFIDLYGITGDFTDKNPYKDLNDFKLKFNPSVYEYIGEFDLIVNKPIHQILWSTNKIQKEFFK